MAKRTAQKFDLSNFKRLSIQSIAIAETSGEDLILAAERCASLGGQKVDDNTYGLLLRMQMIAGAIVEVDGEPVKGASCQDYLKWTTRTRDFVGKLYSHVNGTSEKEDSDFQKLLESPEEAAINAED